MEGRSDVEEAPLGWSGTQTARMGRFVFLCLGGLACGSRTHAGRCGGKFGASGVDRSGYCAKSVGRTLVGRHFDGQAPKQPVPDHSILKGDWRRRERQNTAPFLNRLRFLF